MDFPSTKLTGQKDRNECEHNELYAWVRKSNGEWIYRCSECKGEYDVILR
jgi:hypothetical protein